MTLGFDRAPRTSPDRYIKIGTHLESTSAHGSNRFPRASLTVAKNHQQASELADGGKQNKERAPQKKKHLEWYHAQKNGTFKILFIRSGMTNS